MLIAMNYVVLKYSCPLVVHSQYFKRIKLGTMFIKCYGFSWLGGVGGSAGFKVWLVVVNV